jgi:hypothetical protein
VDRTSIHLSGGNAPYDLTLRYVSRQPPNDQAQVIDVRQSTPWPDTTGAVIQWTAGINGIVRMELVDRVKMTMSGGLSYYRLSGSVQPIGFTTFRLGGHSVLFQDDYRLAGSLEPTSVAGFNIGGDVNVTLGRKTALIVGYRYLGGPKTDVPVRPKAILNLDQVIFQPGVGEIAQWLALAPAHLGVSGSRLVVGLKVMR